jgi:hypothetical protein
MAKNESTAINDLIHRVATMKPLPPDPSEDLMFSPPKPLPRSRSASGTPAAAMTMQGLGTPPQAPARPADRPAAAMTMQGLGPVVQRAVSAPPPPPPSVDDAWTLDEPSRRSARTSAQMKAQAPQPAQPTPPPQAAKAPPPPPAPEPAPPAVERPSRPARRRTTAPRSMPVAAPFESGSMPIVASFGPAKPVHPAPVTLPLGHAVAPATVEMSPSRAWFEQAHERLDHVPHEEAWVGTIQVHRRPSGRALARKLIVPTLLLTVVGVLVGGYFAFQERGERPRNPGAKPGAAAAVTPAKAPEPAKAAVPAPAPAPAPMRTPTAFVDVKLVSSPPGATVTLVDRGKTSFIGTTPITTALDPSRKYELIFSHPSRPTRIEPIDPSATRLVDVTLGRAARAPRPAAAEAPRPRAEKAVAAPAGEGVLMISSKPPCEIFIDGKPTGLTTPQRAIPLPAGSHKVTLVNKAESVTRTIAVQIDAGQPTKVIQDLMK